jgi:hypothetical protein
MSTTLAAPSRQIISLDAGQILTVTPDATAAGRYGRVGNLPGDGDGVSTGYTNLTAGVSVVIGPYIVPTRHAIECSASGITYSASTPTRPFSMFLGKVEGFTGNRTLTADDNGRLLRSDDASGVTITVPNNLAEGFNLSFAQWGAGTVTIAAASGATNRSSVSATTAQYKVGCVLVMKNTGSASAEFTVDGEVS